MGPLRSFDPATQVRSGLRLALPDFSQSHGWYIEDHDICSVFFQILYHYMCFILVECPSTLPESVQKSPRCTDRQLRGPGVKRNVYHLVFDNIVWTMDCA